jgi:hypothetical protein
LSTTYTFTLKKGYEHRLAAALRRFWKREIGSDPPEEILTGILLGIVVGVVASRLEGDRERTLAEIQKAAARGFDEVFCKRTDA